MKRVIILLVGCLTLVQAGSVIAQPLHSTAGDKTIFVFLGKELPKHFSYRVERKNDADTGWTLVAETSCPNSASAVKGQLMDLPPAIASNTIISDSSIARLWQKIKKATTTDSLYAFNKNPSVLFAAGCGWWDNSISRPGTYTYRISKKDRGGITSVASLEKVVYPAPRYSGNKMTPVRMTPGDKQLTISYRIPDVNVPWGGVRMFRSKYKENQFTEIRPAVFFTSRKNTRVVDVTDPAASANTPYSYYIIPADAFGNEGPASDTLNLYNTTQPQTVAMVKKFTATSDEKNDGIALQWKMNNPADLISIDLYRSQGYNKPFTKLISLSPKDSFYLDRQTAPVTTYYYSIVANGNYGRSYPSVRVSGLLKANQSNPFPPQLLEARKEKNSVHLTWRRVDGDTRGFYVYRGTGYTGKMQQAGKLVLSRDSIIHYTDTLPAGNASPIYSYAVAAVNTSYAISPLSRRKSVNASAPDLPVVTHTTAAFTGKAVEIYWSDMQQLNPAVRGYFIFRTALGENGIIAEKERRINKLPVTVNSFTDSLITDGWHYRYRVQSSGADTADVSSPGLAASCAVPSAAPLPPASVLVLNQGNSVLLQWNAPVDKTIGKIRIYRALLKESPKLIAEVNAADTHFSDAKIISNKTYFYLCSAVSNKGKESKLTDAVGIHTK